MTETTPHTAPQRALSLESLRGWVVQLQTGLRSDNLSDDERHDRIIVAQAYLAAFEGAVEIGEAQLESMRCDAKWLLRHPVPTVSLSDLTTNERERIAAYATVQRQMADHRESLRTPSSPAVPAPPVSERKRAEMYRGAYWSWYGPLEAHLQSLERTILGLWWFDTRDSGEIRERLFEQGSGLASRLGAVKRGGAVAWMPEYTHHVPPLDRGWVREALGHTKPSHHADITEWWATFDRWMGGA